MSRTKDWLFNCQKKTKEPKKTALKRVAWAAIESRPERVPGDFRKVQSSHEEMEEAIHSL